MEKCNNMQTIFKEIINEITGLSYAEIVKITFSVSKGEAKKASLKPILLKKNKAWQSEKLINKAAFHENIPESGLRTYLERLLDENLFKQINLITTKNVIAYRISKKSELHRTITKNKTIEATSLNHDREKKYILKEGMPVQPLVDLGVFTGDYRIVKAKYNKFRQINNFLKNIEGGLKLNNKDKINIIEFGCGKSYLTFILYFYFSVIKKINVSITGYDKNDEVVNFCNQIAKKYEYENLKFILGDIADDIPIDISLNENIDIIITLHACDTATDHALFYAIKNKIKHIFCVPCCQHEVNAQIKCSDEYALLLRYGLFKERFSALLTDCIRCELLRGAGYSVDVVEFVGEENTPKNAMIRAYFNGNKIDKLGDILKLTQKFEVEQTLLKLITAN